MIMIFNNIKRDKNYSKSTLKYLFKTLKYVYIRFKSMNNIPDYLKNNARFEHFEF